MHYFFPILLFLYFLAFVLPGIGYPSPIFPQGDEIMHIRSVRETLEHGRWILPELTGLPNPYKPPLLFWLGILSDKLFGESFFSERFVSLLLGLGSSVLIFQIVRFYGRTNLHSFLISLCYAASLGAWKFSRLLMMEQGMTFFVLLFLSLYLIYERKKKVFFLIAASLALGVGYFLKGPILIIYGIIIVFSFFFVDLLRIRRKSYFLSFSKISNYLNHFALLLSFIFPLLWLIYLYFYEESGKQLIQFFFINENAGKFNSENQSAFRIFGGWILYSFPFTILLFSSLVFQIKSRVTSKRTRVVRSLIISVFFFTIFHLLPNRKDSYYIVSFLPILFITMGISQNLNQFKNLFMSKINLLGLIVFLLLCIFFSFWNQQTYAILLFGFYGLIIFISLIEKWKQFWLAYLVFILLIPSFSYLILFPNLDPLISRDLEGYQIHRYCIVSENPWNGMDYQNQSPSAEIVYSPPSTSKQLCEDKNIPILALSPFYSPEGKYKATNEWFVWKSHYNFEIHEILELFRKPGFLKYKTKIKLYEVDGL